ncbi:MAG: GH3 auxin-responsive promoter family protein [Patescibacteria group bacterium]
MGMRLTATMRNTGGALWQILDKAAHDPCAAQTRLLANILRHNRGAKYGQHHDFARIRNNNDFIKAVPVNTFADLASYVEKIKNGQTNILTADAPILFNVTSGTSDQPKFIPVTRRGWRVMTQVSRLWLCRALQDHPAFLSQSLFVILGAPVEGITPSGIPYGSASGMIREGLPRVLRQSLVLPPAISAIEDYDARYYLMARFALENNVSFIATPNPTTLLRIVDTVLRHQHEIIRAIHDGVVFHTWPFDTGAGDGRIMDALGKSLKPNRTRAHFLEAIIRRQGKLSPIACWRELKLIGCWLGGSVGVQAEKLDAFFGTDTPKRDLGYLASEGSMTVPFKDNTAAGILALHSNYYEFIPESEPSTPHGILPRCHELEPGKRYRVVLTNWNGLYRYDIGDVIEVQEFHHQAPIIAFVQKSGDMLNITGEKLHVNHLLTALQRMKKELNVTATQFRMVPDLTKVRYEFLLRLAPEPSLKFIRDTILPFIDTCLCEANIEYRGKRKSKRLLPPCIHIMAPGWEENVRKHFLATGRRDLQYKWAATAQSISKLDSQHIRGTVQA